MMRHRIGTVRYKFSQDQQKMESTATRPFSITNQLIHAELEKHPSRLSLNSQDVLNAVKRTIIKHYHGRCSRSNYEEQNLSVQSSAHPRRLTIKHIGK